MLVEDAEDESSVDGLSDIASTLVQLLQMHDFLPSRGLVLGRLVTLLACLDSPLWVPQLAESTAASEAVFVVLADDYGFDAVPEQEETCLGQEAAWAVLAALSRHLGATNAPTTEVHRPARHKPACYTMGFCDCTLALGVIQRSVVGGAYGKSDVYIHGRLNVDSKCHKPVYTHWICVYVRLSPCRC